MKENKKNYYELWKQLSYSNYLYGATYKDCIKYFGFGTQGSWTPFCGALKKRKGTLIGDGVCFVAEQRDGCSVLVNTEFYENYKQWREGKLTIEYEEAA